jgi:hypothetical protein
MTHRIGCKYDLERVWLSKMSSWILCIGVRGPGYAIDKLIVSSGFLVEFPSRLVKLFVQRFLALKDARRLEGKAAWLLKVYNLFSTATAIVE